MKYILLLLLIILINVKLEAQISVGVITPNSQAILDMNSTNQGVLLSTVALTSTLSPEPLSEHLEGMVVYNTATNGSTPTNVYPGMYYNNGEIWERVDGNRPNFGDIKTSFESADHKGWYLLNGRNISLLSNTARAQAISMGFNSNLPNDNNRILKGGVGVSTNFTELGGSLSFSLARTNLPPITFTGNTSSAGAHEHTYSDRSGQIWHGSTGNAVTGLTNVGGATRTTVESGSHSHNISVPTGGTGQAVTLRPRFLVVRTFIYLGY